MRSFHRNWFFIAALALAGSACGDDGGNPPGNETPVAAFTFNCDLLACTFTDGSTDPDGAADIVSWDWDFGGDGTSEEQSPAHTFSAAGTYQVTLTVTDAAGATNTSAAQAVTVSTTPGNQPPTADFTVECSSLDCTFTNASADADGTFTSSWDFGDGSPLSTETSPVHSYDVTELTPFTITLTVTDNDGDTDVATQEISVSPPANLTCADGTPDCELTIEADAKVTVTLVSSDCELAGNTFKAIITPPGGAPIEETLFTDGCNTPDGTSYQLQSDAVFAAGTTITAQVISGGAVLELPPAVRLTPASAYPEWTLEFDDGAQSEPPEPDFNDLIISIVATPQ